MHNSKRRFMHLMELHIIQFYIIHIIELFSEMSLFFFPFPHFVSILLINRSTWEHFLIISPSILEIREALFSFIRAMFSWIMGFPNLILNVYYSISLGLYYQSILNCNFSFVMTPVIYICSKDYYAATTLLPLIPVTHRLERRSWRQNSWQEQTYSQNNTWFQAVLLLLKRSSNN